jgi:hypothetical protein
MGTIQTDSADNGYTEVDLGNGERLRITLVQAGWAGTPSVRIQIRDRSGHLRQGPEIPLASIGALIGSVVELLSSPLDATRAQRDQPAAS